MTTTIKFLQILVLMAWLFTITCVQAAANPQLNSITLPITDYSQQALSDVLSPALSQVFMQLTGNPNITHDPSVQKALSTPRHYLQGYSYHQEYDSEGQLRLLVTIMFDQDELTAILQQTAPPQTDQQASASPPPLQLQTLVWLQTTEKKHASRTNHAFYKAFSKQMAQLGIGILIPEMDLQDRAAVGEDQKLLFTDEAMQQLAERYAVNAVLVGDIQHKQDKWHSHFKLIWQNHTWVWHQSADTLKELASANANHVIKHYAKDTAAPLPAEATASTPSTTQPTNNVAANPDEITLQISGVNSLDEYTKAMNYLRHLSVVTNVSVNHLKGDDLVLQVQTIAGRSALIAVLATNPLFKEKFHNANPKGTLHYEWQTNNSNSNMNPEDDTSPLQFIEDRS